MKNISIRNFVLSALIFFIVGIGLYYFYPNFIDNPLYIFSKDLITFALSVAGLYIAGGGLFTWKNQIEYKKDHDVADNLHLSLLKLRDAIKHVRNPAIFPSESYSAAQRFKSENPNISEKEMSEKNHAYVYELRWKEIQQASTEVDSNLLMAEVLWGSEIRKKVIPLNKKITELNIALKQNFQPELRTDDFMKIHDVIYDKGDWSRDAEDAFSKDINVAIQEITDYMQSKIS